MDGRLPHAKGLGNRLLGMPLRPHRNGLEAFFEVGGSSTPPACLTPFLASF